MDGRVQTNFRNDRSPSTARPSHLEVFPQISNGRILLAISCIFLQLMKIMGLEKSSENVAWMITTFLEMCFIFVLCQSILYSGGILQTTSKALVYTWLLLFACCVISFCYMISAFFSSASIGSVSAVILFLMTYMPYIVIIALGATLSTFSKVLAVSIYIL